MTGKFGLKGIGRAGHCLRWLRLNWLLLGISISLPLVAQQTGISGRVADASKAVLADAKVTVTAADGTEVATVTNATGLYQFPGLRAGTYVLRFEAPGFAPAERTVSCWSARWPPSIWTCRFPRPAPRLMSKLRPSR